MTSEGTAPLEAPAASRLARLIRVARRRLAWRRAVERAARVLPWSLALTAVVLIALRLVGARLPWTLSQAELLSGAAALALLPPLLLAPVAAFARRPSDEAVALLIDRAFGTRETATAAIALRDAPDAAAWASRALGSLGEAPMARAVPLRPVPWRAAAALASLATVAFLMPPLPAREAPPAAPPDPHVTAVAQALQEEARAAEEALEERGAPPEALRMLEEVRRAGERAEHEGGSRPDVLAELERLDQQARREQQRRQAADAGALERALSSIEQAMVAREGARQASASQAASLEQQLRELSERFEQGSKFEERDARRMAARLRDAADALRESRPDLAAKLEELADAIEAGDGERAAQLARELAQSPELQQLADDAAGDEALAQARQIVRQAMAAMGRAPTDDELLGEGQDGGGGDGEGEGEGGQPGERGRGRDGRVDLAADWGVGSTDEASPAFDIKRRGRQQDRQTAETSDWREAYRELHEATRLESARMRESRVRGAPGAGEIIAVESRAVARGREGAALPVVRVPESYARAAEDALAREEIPMARRETVRRYFTAIAGSPGPIAEPEPAPPEPPPKEP